MTQTTVDQRPCLDCGLVKPSTEFHAHRIGKDGLRSTCKACRATYAKERYVPKLRSCVQCGHQWIPGRRKPFLLCEGCRQRFVRCSDCERIQTNEEHGSGRICRGCDQTRKRRKAYGLEPSQYEALLAAQEGGCRICSRSPEENGRALAVDHDHACCPGSTSCGRCIRGLLCSLCNRALGCFGDDRRSG